VARQPQDICFTIQVTVNSVSLLFCSFLAFVIQNQFLSIMIIVRAFPRQHLHSERMRVAIFAEDAATRPHHVKCTTVSHGIIQES